MSGVHGNGKAYTVDVVIPTFNRPKELRRCLASLDDQTIMPASVIVVDDSKDDNGPAISRNIGWRKGTSEIVAFTDDDCVPSKDWIENIILRYERDGAQILEGSITTGQRGAGGTMDPHPKDRWNRFKTANMAYRRNILESLGGFDERYYIHREDTDLAWRAINAGYKITWAPDCVVHHPDRSGVQRIRPKSELLLYYCDEKKYLEVAAAMISVKSIFNGKLKTRRLALRDYQDEHVRPISRFASVKLWTNALTKAILRRFGL